MLQDKYLPEFDFSSDHAIVIDASVANIFPLIREFKIKNPPISYWLMTLRGMSAPKYFSMQHLENSRFVLMEEADSEIILGIIGQPWTRNGHLQKFHPNDFISFNDPRYIKASWSFELKPISHTQTKIKTETRIFCPTPKVRRKFGRYWWFIKPFSGIIRQVILKAVKRQSEENNR